MFRQIHTSETMKKIIWGGLLAIIIPSFVAFYGWGDYSRAGSTGFRAPVAKIEFPNGKPREIVYGDLQQAENALRNDVMYYLQSSGTYMDQNSAQNLVNQDSIIDEAINREIVKNYAAQNGISVSTNEAVEFVQSQTTDEQRKQILQHLQQQQIPYKRYIENMADNILHSKVMSAVSGQIRATETEAWKKYQKTNEKITADFIKVNAADFRSSVTIEEKSLNDYFNSNIQDFQVPEQVKYSYIMVTKDDLKSSATVAQDDVTSYYNTHKEEFKTAKKARLRQILLKQKTAQDIKTTSTEALAAANAEVKKQADDILSKINGGEDFAKLADQFTQETFFPPRADMNTTSSDRWTSAGGNLGLILEPVAKSTYGDSWTSEVFTLKPGSVSGVIETPQGYHIVKAEEIIDGIYQPVDQVQPIIEDKIRGEKSLGLFNKIGEELYDLKEKHTGLNQLAKAAGLTVRNTDNVNKTTSFIPGIGMLGPEFTDAISSLDKGVVSEVISDSNRHLVIQLDEEIPAHDPELATVKAQVEEAYKNHKSQEIAQETAEKIKASVKNLAELEKYALDNGTTVTKSQPFNRNQVGQSLGPIADFEKSTENLKVGDIGVSGISPNGKKPTAFVVWTASKIEEPTKEDFIKVLPAEMQKLTRDKQQILFLEFLRDQRELIKNKVKLASQN